MDSDVAPPAPPAEKPKKGLFGKLFKKKEPSPESFIDELTKKTDSMSSALPDIPNLSIDKDSQELPDLPEPKSDLPEVESDLPDLPSELPDWTPEKSAADEIKDTLKTLPKEPPAVHNIELPAISDPVPKKEAKLVSEKPKKEVHKPVHHTKKHVVHHKELAHEVIPEHVVKKADKSASHEIKTLKKDLEATKKKKVSKKAVTKVVKKVTAKKELDSFVNDLHSHNKTLDEDIKKVITSKDDGEVHPRNYFLLKNGKYLKSFSDLLKAVDKMDETTFNHHVSHDKNHFAQWVKDILRKEKLAEKMRTTQAKSALLTVLKKHDASLDAKINSKVKEFESRKKENFDLIEKVKVKQKALDDREDILDAREQEVLDLESLSEAKIHLRLKRFEKAMAAKEAAVIAKEKRSASKRDSDLKKTNEELKVLRETIRKEKFSHDEQESKRMKALREKESEFKKYSTTNKRILEQDKIKTKGLEDKYNFKLEELKKAQEKLKKEKVAAQKMIAKAKTFRTQQKRLEARDVSLKKREAAYKRKVKDLDKRAVEIKSSKKVASRELAEAHEEKAAADKGVFDKYLSQKLKEINPEHLELPDNITKKHHKLFDSINECRDILSKGKIDEAKNKYNSVKKEFSKGKFESHEKALLYNAIRELYDDIHLAMLSSE